MSVDVLLNKLAKVKKTGANSWKACCPAHGSTKQSLAIKDDNGKVLIHCFAEGCDILSVLGAVGLDMNDVQPKLNGEHRPIKKPFYAGDVLDIASDEVTIAYMIVKKMLDNTVNKNDMDRLLVCASRLRHASDVANKGI